MRVKKKQKSLHFCHFVNDVSYRKNDINSIYD